MELRKVNTRSHVVTIAPLGDIQWSGDGGPSAIEHVQRHIKRALDHGAWFVGMGDYIDFLSPSNRARLRAAALYDTADAVVEEKASELCEEVFDKLLKPTKGRWLGMLEGHHFFEGSGSTSDMWLADMLDADFLGTSAFIKVVPANVTIYVHHGMGNSVLPSGPLNKLYHTSQGWAGADIYMMGHTTKLNAARLSRPFPTEGMTELDHRDIYLVNTGGFSKSSIIGHARGRIRRGDYAEQKMLTPCPLGAPLIHIDGKAHKSERIRVEI